MVVMAVGASDCGGGWGRILFQAPWCESAGFGWSAAPVAARPPRRPPQNRLVPIHHRQAPAQTVPLEGGGRTARSSGRGRPDEPPPIRPPAHIPQSGTRPNRPFGGGGRAAVLASGLCQRQRHLSDCTQDSSSGGTPRMHVMRFARGHVGHSTTDSPSKNISHASEGYTLIKRDDHWTLRRRRVDRRDSGGLRRTNHA